MTTVMRWPARSWARWQAAAVTRVDEHITVVTGSLRTGPTDNLHEAAPGDFISYRADIPHSYIAGDDPVLATVVMTYLLALPDFAHHEDGTPAP